MAQKGLMRILSRKDGKDTVSVGKENEKAKVTKVLKFVPAIKPEQAQLMATRPKDGKTCPKHGTTCLKHRTTYPNSFQYQDNFYQGGGGAG